MSESWWCHEHDHDPDHCGLPHKSSLSSYNSLLETNQSEDQNKTSISDAQSKGQIDRTNISVTNNQDHAQTDTAQKERNITIDLPDAHNQEDLTCNQILRCDHYLNSYSEIQPCSNGSCQGQLRDTDRDNSCKERLPDENRLLMGVADCLVSDINVLFDESSLLPRSCLTTDRARVQCARCRGFLGRFKNSGEHTIY